MSSAEYRYGVVRRRGGSQPSGGTSVAGSLACSQRAKPRTTVSRIPSHPAEAFGGALTQASASSLVTRLTPACSQKLTNCSSSRPSRASLKPSERRTARYSVSAARNGCPLMTRLLAREGRAHPAHDGRLLMAESGIGTLRIPSPHRGGSRGPVRLPAIGQPSGLPALPEKGPLLRVPPRGGRHPSEGRIMHPAGVSASRRRSGDLCRRAHEPIRRK